MKKRPKNYDITFEDFNEDSNPNLDELDDIDYVGITDYIYENENPYPDDPFNKGLDALIHSSNIILQNPKDPELYD
ncbi:hypothetical protein [Paratissierella segnis]|jgi:hypothetical protein|uniref:Uncharacterized protein n=1 Tax=Paratissierella segnis TaxID=2763679 RepID=A0A926ER04_9FIRM|nr:hypothetical protein [Paratissierella segnis]MBC8586910.1 hypothetical protein [Paratissierella segnis]